MNFLNHVVNWSFYYYFYWSVIFVKQVFGDVVGEILVETVSVFFLFFQSVDDFPWLENVTALNSISFLDNSFNPKSFEFVEESDVDGNTDGFGLDWGVDISLSELFRVESLEESIGSSNCGTWVSFDFVESVFVGLFGNNDPFSFLPFYCDLPSSWFRNTNDGVWAWGKADESSDSEESDFSFSEESNDGSLDVFGKGEFIEADSFESEPFVVSKNIGIFNVEDIDGSVDFLDGQEADFKMSSLLVFKVLNKHDSSTIGIFSSDIFLESSNDGWILIEFGPSNFV